jgi:hypothetical protein
VGSNEFQRRTPVDGVEVPSDYHIPAEFGSTSNELGIFPSTDKAVRLLEDGAGLATPGKHVTGEELNVAEDRVGERSGGNALADEPVTA